MADPFEDAMSQLPPSASASGSAAPPAPPIPAPAIPVREHSVSQAVNFLNDPRVRSADMSRAVVFLRGKGITDDELRHAFHRLSLPLPPMLVHQQLATSIIPPHLYPAPVALPPPQPQRPGWVSLLLGLTAAAGLYTAVREVLRLYVVPLYFPDAARAAENRLNEEKKSLRDLEQTVRNLCISSQQTNDRVDQLATSIASSVAMREREVSSNTELRDAIRQLSRSVTASMSMSSAQTGVTQSVFGRRDVLSSVNGRISDSHLLQEERPVEEVREENSGKPVAVIDDADDDFMNIKPAVVQPSWSAHNSSTLANPKIYQTPGAAEEEREVERERKRSTPASCASVKAISRTSLNLSQVENAQLLSTKTTLFKDDKLTEQQQREFRSPQSTNGQSEPNPKPDHDIGVGIADADGDVDADADAESKTDVGTDGLEDADVDADVDPGDDEDDGEISQAPPPQGKGQFAAARQLFESEVIAETRHLFGTRPAKGLVVATSPPQATSATATTTTSGRPLSMPPMDGPLSEIDY